MTPDKSFSSLQLEGITLSGIPIPDNHSVRENHYRQLAESMSQLAWMAKPDGWIFWYNARWYEYTGTTPEQMEGWGWQSVHDLKALPKVLERWQASIETGDSFHLEFPLKGADGKFRRFLTRVSAVRDESGEIILWFGTNTDVEDSYQVVDQRQEILGVLEAERSNLAEIVEMSPAFIVILRGENHVVERANERYYHLIRRDDIVGKPIIEALPEMEGQGFIDLLNGVYSSGEPFYGNEISVYLEFNGVSQISILNFVFQAMRGADGNVNGIFVHGVDVTEMLAARKAIEYGERQRQLAFESADFGSWHIDIETQILTSDPRFREIFGITDQGVTYLDAFSRTHPDDRAIVQLNLEASMQRDHPVPFKSEFRVQTADGNIIWVLGQGRANYVGSGSEVRPVSLDGTVMDITDRKLSEVKLALLAEQRQLALDAASMGWWHIDPATNIITYDRRYAEIFEIPGFEIPNDEVLKRLHPDDLPLVAAKVVAALNPNHSQPLSVQYRILRQDGSIRWIEAHGIASFEGVGRDRHASDFVGTVADITNQVAIQEGLRNSEAEFRQLADSMPQIVWAARPDGVLNYYNRQWYEYIIVREGSGTDTSWDKYVHPDDFPAVARLWSECLSNGEPYSLEFRVRNSAGIYRSFLVRALPIRNDSGVIIRWFGTCTDIEDRRIIEAELENLLVSERTARAESDKQSRIKDEFLATLSHEIRTPLNAILGWSQLMKKSLRPEDLATGLEVIERNARAQAQIIDDLLDMSRIMSGKVRLDLQRLDLSATVQWAVDTSRPTAEAKSIKLTSVLDPLPGVSVSGDANRLQEVLWNLLSNAIKFTPKDGQVKVILERVNSHLEISVIDSGEGIESEFLPYVFDRFRQADASTSRRHGGLGLGLSIVKQLVELHGGSVEARSQGLGHGTTFTVSLPLLATKVAKATEVERSHPYVNRGLNHVIIENRISGLKILVVDDESDARALVKRILEECGAVVTEAGSANEALHHVEGGTFDLIVSDIGMPGQDGYSLIRRIRKLGKDKGGDIPAIALTAYARTEDRVQAVAAGFLMHVAKPVEPIELITMVAGAAGRTGQSD